MNPWPFDSDSHTTLAPELNSSAPTWREAGVFSAAERELRRVHAREQARLLATFARRACRRARLGGAAAFFPEGPGGPEASARRLLETTREELRWARADAAPLARGLLDSIASRAGADAEDDATRPSARELADEALALHPGAEQELTSALVELVEGRFDRARAAVRSVAERGLDAARRATAEALLGSTCLAEGDDRGALRHFEAAQAAHAPSPAIASALLELARRSARMDLAALARRVLAQLAHRRPCATARARRRTTRLLARLTSTSVPARDTPPPAPTAAILPSDADARSHSARANPRAAAFGEPADAARPIVGRPVAARRADAPRNAGFPCETAEKRASLSLAPTTGANAYGTRSAPALVARGGA